MSIVTHANLYRGINPHLNSILQTPGIFGNLSKWPSFHASHISDIANALNAVLPPNYTARAEQSLQVLAEDILVSSLSQRRPDVTVYGESSPANVLRGDVVAEPLVLALDETLDVDEDFATAVVIHEIVDDSVWGRAVTRIELLSPSNKPGHIGYEHYNRGRTEAIFTGIPLVELDYLHESPPPLGKVPVYPHEPNAHPYHVFVNVPRPSVKEGQVFDYFFDVDSSFPTVKIPLSGEDALEFDFGAVYQQTYKLGRWGNYRNLVDYAELPARFDTYSPADQARIKARMQEIAEAQSRGDDLETRK